jgi:curved DNA-binding protein CbpA
MATEDRIREWLEQLDRLTYYEIFGLAPVASDDDVRVAFHAFCETFHPDNHRGLPESEAESVATIFRRGAEAFDVLMDPVLRRQYDAEIALRGSGKPPPRLSQSPHTRRPPSSLEDAVRVPSARPFAQRAEELVREGDFRQAKLHLVLANHRDPENPALEAALRELEDYLASLR